MLSVNSKTIKCIFINNYNLPGRHFASVIDLFYYLHNVLCDTLFARFFTLHSLLKIKIFKESVLNNNR